MANYVKSLTADLPRWVGMGYVNEAQAELLLKDVTARAGQGWLRLPLILSMLGAVLLFGGIISLVAANWEFMPALTKLTLLIGGLGLTFAAAAYARAKGSAGLGEGLAFLAVLIFGANIMLIGQIYHMPPNPAAGTLVWALGAALVALLWPSQLVGALALILAMLWSWFAQAGHSSDVFALFFGGRAHAPHWPFLLLWGGLSALAAQRNWTKALHVAALTLVIWVMYNTAIYFDEVGLQLGGFILAVLLMAMHYAGRFIKLAKPGSGIISHYLWVGMGLWLLVISVPFMWYHSGFLGLSGVMQALAGVLMISVWAIVRNHARTVAAAFLCGCAVPLMIVLPRLIGSGEALYRYNAYGYYAGHGGMVQIALTIFVLAAALGGILHGYYRNEKLFINLGFFVFTAKLIWVYFDTIWQLSSRALFMMIGGVLVIGLGIVIDRQRRKLLSRMSGKEGGV